MDSEWFEKWRTWLSELKKCNNLILPRSIMPTKQFEENPTCSLVGFSDGSAVAHGGVLYLRWTDKLETVIDVKFLAAKRKLNPINGVTVPRAELCGALLLSRITYSLEEALEKTEVQPYIVGKRLFTDSTAVLSWIRADAIMFKPFVKNKVLEIDELHTRDTWSFIS